MSANTGSDGPKRRARPDDRGAARREKAAALRAAAVAQERRRRNRIIVLAAAIGVVVLAGVIGIAVQSSRKESKPVIVPAHATGPDNGIVVGRSDAPVTVEFYEDFQCPACEALETSTGSTINKLIDAGKMKAVYHMMSFIGPDSVRAANAGAAAADAGKFKAYHDVLYANQPAENSGGFTNDRLIELGKRAGLTSTAFADAVRSGKYDGFVAKVGDTASKRGVTSTPTVLLNGTQLQGDQLTPDGFTAAITKAAGSAGTAGATGAPTPTAPAS
jgi:protein-disulfide isomerase